MPVPPERWPAAWAWCACRSPATATAERSTDLRARLLAAGTDAPTHVQAGAIWLRLSAAAYNDIEDYERLAEIVARVVREVR